MAKVRNETSVRGVLEIYGDAAGGEVFFHLFYSVIFKYVGYLAQEVQVLGDRGA